MKMKKSCAASLRLRSQVMMSHQSLGGFPITSEAQSVAGGFVEAEDSNYQGR